MDKDIIKKEYSNGEITVVWQSAKCSHSGNCFRNLPKVFRPSERPWVKINDATSAEIINAVAKCPSGALSIKENDLV